MAAINLLLLLFSSSCTAFITPLKRSTNKCTTNIDYLAAKKNDGSEITINRRDVLQQASSSIIAATSIMTPTVSSASENEDLAYLG